jgi:hypothetical protein
MIRCYLYYISYYKTTARIVSLFSPKSIHKFHHLTHKFCHRKGKIMRWGWKQSNFRDILKAFFFSLIKYIFLKQLHCWKLRGILSGVSSRHRLSLQAFLSLATLGGSVEPARLWACRAAWPRDGKALWEVGEDWRKCFPDIIKKVTSESATFLGKISCY